MVEDLWLPSVDRLPKEAGEGAQQEGIKVEAGWLFRMDAIAM